MTATVIAAKPILPTAEDVAKAMLPTEVWAVHRMRGFDDEKPKLVGVFASFKEAKVYVDREMDDRVVGIVFRTIRHDLRGTQVAADAARMIEDYARARADEARAALWDEAKRGLCEMCRGDDYHDPPHQAVPERHATWQGWWHRFPRGWSKCAASDLRDVREKAEAGR